MVTKQDLILSLRLMDIREGDTLLVHSSLSSIGHVEGGAETVVEALLEAVEPEGTIVMSTLTGWSQPFDAATSPSAVGKISEVFRRRPDAARSLHPVHSVAAVGRHAQWITAGHEDCPTGCGKGTPYLKLLELGGKIMMLGVDLDRNTIMHSLEEEIDAVYLRTLDIPAPTYVEGYRGKKFTLKKFPPGHRDFMSLTPVLRRSDALVEGRMGDAAVKVMDARTFFRVALAALEEDPLLFICHNPNCNSCHWSKLLHEKMSIDYGRYRGNGCVDDTCEICVVD